jgi:hypothetical protein
MVDSLNYLENGKSFAHAHLSCCSKLTWFVLVDLIVVLPEIQKFCATPCFTTGKPPLSIHSQ